MRLLAYGTLEFPEVMQAVTGKAFRSVPADLIGYERYLLAGQLYPGIINTGRGRLTGTLYLDLDPHSLRLLDRFEDECYSRRPVATVLRDERTLRALTYLIPGKYHPLVTKIPWDADQFRTKHLQNYLTQCRKFMHTEMADA